MIAQPISIASVNMQHRNLMSHTLLQTTPFDIVIMQEPWCDPIRTVRSDSDPAGSSLLGLIANDMWDSFSLPPSYDVRVAVFAKRSFTSRPNVKLIHRFDHPLASPNSMVLDVLIDEECLRIINIYHRRPDKGHALHYLLQYVFPPEESSCRELTTLWVVRLNDGTELKVTDPKEQQRDVEEEETEDKERREWVDCRRRGAGCC